MYRKVPLALSLLTLSACGANASFDDASWSNPTAATTWSDTDQTVAGTAPDVNTTPPPEVEENSLFLAPAQTDVFVFVANPERDTVTRINVNTNEVDTTPVGIRPEVVITTPDYMNAVVFNAGDDTVSLIEAWTLQTTTVAVRDNFNDMVLSPDGGWAVLWHNQFRPEDVGQFDGALQSFNEVSFVNVATGEHFPMAVGFNPKRVVFTADGTRAGVVSDAYLAVIDLTESQLSPSLIELAPGVIEPPEAEEVVMAPSGDYAFIRQFGTNEVLVADLIDGTVTPVAVGDNPTDLDLSPDGTEAVVITRGSGELWTLDTLQPLLPPTTLQIPSTTPLGSMLFDPTGDKVVLYTTSTVTDHYVTWDRTDNSFRERTLVKPIASMAVTPTGGSLLAFHPREDAADADPTSPFYNEWALTLISLDDFRTNPLLLPAEPAGYANSNNGRQGFFIMKDQPYLEILDYETLLHDEIELRSIPQFVGVLPDLDPDDGIEPVAWASQDHALGRISFYDPNDEAVETITGFELNAQIETE